MLYRLTLAASVLSALTFLAAPDAAAQSTAGQSDGSAFLLSVQAREPASYFGIRMHNVDPDRAGTTGADGAVEVLDVLPGSPAAKAGLKTGDVLLSYNGENILGAQQLMRMVSETPVNRRVKVQYWRNGEHRAANVTLAAQPRLPDVPAQSSGYALNPSPLFAVPSDIPAPLVIWKNNVIGVEAEEIDDQFATYFGVKQGVLIRSVDAPSPASKAGLKSGDVVIAVGDRRIVSPRELSYDLVAQAAPGRPVSLSIVRERKRLTLNVLLSFYTQ